MPRDRAPGTVAVRLLAFPGVDDLDLLGAYGVLSKAAELTRAGPPPWLEVALVADRAQLETAGGLRLSVQTGLDEVSSPDVVVVPGGRGVRQVLEAPAYLDYLRAAHRSGAALYSVCSGALLVAAAGLAAGATLAIHAAKRDALTELAAGCRPGTGLVRDGSLTSVGGDRSGSVKSVDLALQLVADHAPRVLPELLDRMELRQGRTLVTVPAGRSEGDRAAEAPRTTGPDRAAGASRATAGADRP
ncbi:DJ-1/PfpI family protein [Jatrophihabitans sp.]|uniref:DJ-1/PfpI family protein n=1 Tax=Jatrophihabitans sp. TaxID=1932789 RepID=UPI002B8DCE08|nr:DJ-1/PfpI family protein [Jatrophihabitans sp.]